MYILGYLRISQDVWDYYTTFMFTSLCEKSFYKIFVLHDMHMILESLESDFKRALIDTKISQIACWEHIEPKNNTLQWHSLIINTSRGLVFTMEEFAFHTINTFYS